IFIHVGGYKHTPEQIKTWFNERGVELQEGFYTVLANRYLYKENYYIRSCDYEGVHSFIVITHRKTTEGSVGSGGQVIKFEEDDQASHIKAEMGLQEVEFVTVTIWVG
ncbi:hypothetical protein BYT27DRAFT_7309731, partial [Phlegmacium glaucopus]